MRVLDPSWYKIVEMYSSSWPDDSYHRRVESEVGNQRTQDPGTLVMDDRRGATYMGAAMALR